MYVKNKLSGCFSFWRRGNWKKFTELRQVRLSRTYLTDFGVWLTFGEFIWLLMLWLNDPFDCIARCSAISS